MGWGTQPLRRIMRLGSALRRMQNLNVTINSEALNELSNYKLPALVTYRFGVSMGYTGIRRGEVPSPNGLGNPTPTKDYASGQRAYTNAKSKCYNQSEALNELQLQTAGSCNL